MPFQNFFAHSFGSDNKEAEKKVVRLQVRADADRTHVLPETSVLHNTANTKLWTFDLLKNPSNRKPPPRKKRNFITTQTSK